MAEEKKDVTKTYKDPPGVKTATERKDFAFLAGARILQGVGLVLLFQTATPVDATRQVASAVVCIIAFIVGSYLELIFHES